MEPNLESSVGLFTTDAELTIQIWDSVLESMTGISADAAIGRDLLEVIPEVGSRSSVLARLEGRYPAACEAPILSRGNRSSTPS